MLTLLLLLSSRTSDELKRALHQAKENEDRKSAVLQSSLDAIIILDQDGNILEWNKAAEVMLGYREEEAISKDLVSLIIPVQEGLKQNIRHYLSTRQDSIMGQRLELTVVRKNGEEFPAEVSIVSVPLPGSVFFAAILRDISEHLSLIHI